MKRAVTTTHLEMTSRPATRSVPASESAYRLIRAELPCPELNRFLYTTVGAHWWYNLEELPEGPLEAWPGANVRGV